MVIVFGTRPEIIKVAPVINAFKARGIDIGLVHTGQHYTYEMDSLIQTDLHLPPPSHNLQIGSGSHAVETSKALVGLETLYAKIQPSLVLVQGDTNSTLAGALAAAKMQIPVGHIEAGLRSFQRQMPEEVNRVLTDHISEILFAPTKNSLKNLISEGIPQDRALVTGNTIVDSLNVSLHSLDRGEKPQIPELSDDFLLLTLHREENVDTKEVLSSLIEGVASSAEYLGTQVLFPAHPRTVKRIKQFGISIPSKFMMLPPLGYLNFLRLEREANLVFTDSGGVQEEACVLGVPCVTLRNATERPETLEVGANILAGPRPKDILHAATVMMKNGKEWDNPFGSGKAGEVIVDAIIQAKWA